MRLYSQQTVELEPPKVGRERKGRKGEQRGTGRGVAKGSKRGSKSGMKAGGVTEKLDGRGVSQRRMREREIKERKRQVEQI